MNSITIYNEFDLTDRRILIPLICILIPYITFIILTLIEPIKDLEESKPDFAYERIEI